MIDLDYNLGVINLYNLSDTISSYNNQPGFTGTQDNYTFVYIPFRTDLWEANLLIRFIISTDSVNMNNEGWMIDELSFGWYDFWDIKDANNNKTLFIYPNPSNNNFTITTKEIIINKIEILDLNGQVLKTELLTNNINVKDLFSGVYLIRINDKFIRKIIVQ